MDKIFLILPGCDDTNRGDQALIWETVSIAREAGYCGQYYMIAETEKSRQSEQEAIGHTDYILPHPSTYFKDHNNIQYGKLLKFKWAVVSIKDSLRALLLLSKLLRRFATKLFPENIQKSIQLFERADAAFVKGGGFLHSYGGLVNTYANFYDLYHIMLALSMRKDVYVMPNSFGPFLSPGTERMIRKVLSKCKFISVRESLSRDMLYNELGIEAKLLPDLAFYLGNCDKLNEEQKQKLNAIPFDKKCVAMTVRPYRFPGADDPDEEYQKYKMVISDFIVYLNKKGYHPVLVEHTFSDNEHEQDMSCIKDIEKILDNSCDYSVYSDLSLNCRQLKYVYSKFDYVLGTRFHSVIFSIANLVPAIAITYGGNKGMGIMKDIGLSEYALSIDQLSLDSLIDTFDMLTANIDHVKQQILAYMDLAQKKKVELIASLKGGTK